MSLYYQYMEHYMGPALFAITMQAIKSDQPDISLQGIEFWSNVCDEEIELAFEASEAADLGRPPSRTSKFYAKGALQFLVPSLLEILTKQDEDADDDEWNPCKAASVCLMLLSNCVEDDIVQYVLPFVQANISSTDWHFREAAMMAFGSIMEGPSNLVPIVKQALNVVLTLAFDKSINVRDTTFWVLNKICEQVAEAVLEPETLKSVLEVLLQGLKAEPRVAANACWAINSLSESAHELALAYEGVSENPSTFALSPYFQSIVNFLLECADRPDSVQNNLRTSAYEALMELIKNSAKDCYQIVGATTLILLDRLKKLLNVEERMAGDPNLLDLQSLLCTALQSVLRKMTTEDAPKISDAIMTATLQMLIYSAKSGSINEDALLLASSLAEILGSNFVNYYPHFKEYLFAGLKSYQNASLCSVAIGVIADLCPVLSKELVPFCDEIMANLLEALSNDAVQRRTKSEILRVFGDIALAIDLEFKKYLEPVLQTLLQASNVNINRNNYEMVDYANELWESTLHAYTGIVQALKSEADSNCYMLLQDHFANIYQFLIRIASEYAELPDNIISAAAGLIGDMVSVFGPSLQPLIDNTFVQSMFAKGKKSKSTNTRTMVAWVNREMKRVRSQQESQMLQVAQNNVFNSLQTTTTAES